MTERRPRVLIVRLGALGDVVHAIPAVAALRRSYPDAQIDWVVEPLYADLVRLVRSVDRVIPLDTRGSWVHVLTAFRRLWGGRYDAAVDFQGLVKSAAIARIAVPRRAIGFPREHLREPVARVFYTETADPERRRHVVQKNLALLRAMEVCESHPVFPLTVPHTSAVEAVEGRYGAGNYVLLNPAAAWPNKRWPAIRFGGLADRIRHRLGIRSLVLWGRGEEPLAAEVAACSAGAADIAPPTSIVDLPGLARRALLMVSGDTGPLHVAAAVGTPVVALFGPTDPERNGPWSPSDISVSQYGSCSCHYERRCRRAMACIEEIGLAEVMAAVERRVGPAARAAAPDSVRQDR